MSKNEIFRVAAGPEKSENDREFFKIYDKNRFLFVLNVLHKVIMHFEIPALFVQSDTEKNSWSNFTQLCRLNLGHKDIWTSIKS